jgi:uncharacterized coiled-coil protein SlyX
MTYKDNQPTFNVNRKVVNFKDFLANPNAEKEELKKMDRQNKPNTDDQQKNMANSRYKFNSTTRKMDDLSPAEIEDKIDAIEELEEGVNNDALYAISDSFNKVSQELNLLNKRLGWSSESEELGEFVSEISQMKVKFDELLMKFNDFDNKHFER